MSNGEIIVVAIILSLLVLPFKGGFGVVGVIIMCAIVCIRDNNKKYRQWLKQEREWQALQKKYPSRDKQLLDKYYKKNKK